MATRVFEVITTNAYGISFNGWSFTIFYGRRNGNGFIAIPNWGVCVEAGEPDDVFYNTEQLANCKDNTVSENAKALAETVREIYGNIYTRR